MPTWLTFYQCIELAASGRVELTTTPLPSNYAITMMDGWTMEDGIRVNKESWREDVQNHLITGMDLFEEKLGFRPTGMWPSEEAVSPAMVEPVSDVGIQWMVTDEEILMKSTDVNGNMIDVDIASNLATPWLVTKVQMAARWLPCLEPSHRTGLHSSMEL